MRYYLGSSPRARGTARRCVDGALLARFIPACAGNRAAGWWATLSRPVHPRVRGEQFRRRKDHANYHGSSPRARGTAQAMTLHRKERRFIPACAGNRPRRAGASANSEVHPRVRGEQVLGALAAMGAAGSSPRARGTGCAQPAENRSARFIPACAGNSVACAADRRGHSVHPRVRGEQNVDRQIANALRGSSPRARGTAALPHRVAGVFRFIPACAGNRESDTRSLSANSGSSPRARGTAMVICRRVRFYRFIPACAGNSQHESAPVRRQTVHPRVRGEQSISARHVFAGQGSSPRARGTGNALLPNGYGERFIPACAGNSGRGGGGWR